MRLKNTDPAVISAGVSEYVVDSTVCDGEKDPVPLAFQAAAAVSPAATDPLRATVPAEEQMVWLGPALAEGVLTIRICTVSFVAGQMPLLVEVSVKITVPLLISAVVME